MNAPSLSGLMSDWNPDTRTLSFDGDLCKRFSRRAAFEKLLLTAFTEEGWRRRIDNPLPGDGRRTADARLHDVVRRLNEQIVRRNRFFRDGTGEGVCWEPIPKRRKRRKPR